MRVKNYWTLQWMHNLGLLSEDIAPINLRSRLAHALRGHPHALRVFVANAPAQVRVAFSNLDMMND